MYGWRARLGILLPSGNLTIEPEFGLVTPDGVSCHYHRFKFTGNGRDIEEIVGTLKRAEEYVGDAAALICDVRPAVVVMAGTGVSFIDGHGHDQRLIKKMRERNGNLPTTTTSTCVAAALQTLGIKKVSMSMPYPEEVAKAAVKFVEDSGVQVLDAKWLNRTGFQMAEVTAETLYHLSKEVDRPESQAIFISCTGLHTFEIIEKLERDLKKPVITSNQATIWNILRMAGITDSIEGYGQLLSKY
jgi:maleate isomerase